MVPMSRCVWELEGCLEKGWGSLCPIYHWLLTVARAQVLVSGISQAVVHRNLGGQEHEPPVLLCPAHLLVSPQRWRPSGRSW